MLYHASLPARGGHIGVNVFFVLSGFLITWLLLQERIEAQSINFRRFYLRRILRLYPALVFMIAGVTLYILAVPSAPVAEETLWGTFPAMFYFANWVRAFNGLGTMGLYEHTWSLSIEEQFYFIWPIAIWLIYRISPKGYQLLAVGTFAALGCLASLAVRLIISPGPGGYERIFNGLDTQGDQLLYGCLLAVLILGAKKAHKTDSLKRVFSIGLIPSVVLLTALAILWPHHGVSPIMRVAFSAVGISAAVLIGYCFTMPDSPLSRFFSLRVFVYIGRRSYALYLWHYPLFGIIRSLEPSGGEPAFILTGFVASFIAAEISARLVEAPISKLKNKVASAPASEPPSSSDKRTDTLQEDAS